MAQAVDLQVILPRTQDVGRIQHIQQSNEQNQQQTFAVHLAHDAEVAQKTVQNTPQSREARIKSEEHKQKKSLQNQRERPAVKKKDQDKTPEEEWEKVAYPNMGLHVDLKI